MNGPDATDRQKADGRFADSGSGSRRAEPGPFAERAPEAARKPHDWGM
jgi:hypothetical protein